MWLQRITEVIRDAHELALPLVVDGPLHLPCLPVILRSFPTPIKFVGGIILPNHPLQRFCALWTDGLALQNHLAIPEFANEIEIHAAVVDPCLCPFARRRVEQ